MLSPGDVIIATGMASTFGVHQRLRHQHWKPEQDRRMLTVISQTQERMLRAHHVNPCKFPGMTSRSIWKSHGLKRVRAVPEIY